MSRYLQAHRAAAPSAHVLQLPAAPPACVYLAQVNDLLMLGRDLKLREDREKGVYVEGLAAIEVESEQALCDVVTKGNASRATSSTAMNERSSRGHTIFLMEVSQLKRSSTDADTYTTTEAKLYLVDLAGSECIKQSQVSGAGLREAQNINKSLSTLGLCIEKLTDGKAGSEQHVPYRDSKLTRILAQTLGGNCKTTLLVALRPEAECAPECVATLRFAQRAKRLTTKIGANSKVERKTEGGGGGAAAFFFKLKNTINFADFQRKEGELKAEQTRLESQLEAEHAAHEAQLAAVQEEARRDREELQQRLRQDEEQRKKEKGKVVAGRLGNALARGEAQQSREDQRQLEQQNTAMAEELHALRAQLAAQANHGGGEEERPGLMERTMSRAEHLTGLDLDGDGVVGEAEGRSLGGSLEESAEESWDEDTCTSPYEEEAVAGGEGIAASDDAVDAPGSPLSPPLVPPPAVHARSRGARSPRSAATWAAPSADEAPQQAASPLASPSPPVPSPPPRGSGPTREGPTARTAPATVAHAHPPDLGRARAAAEGSRGSPRGARRARGAAAPAGAPSPQPHKGRASKGQNGGSGGPLVASPPETGVWGKAWTLTELEREEELKRVNYENHQLRLHLEEAHQRLSDEAQRAEEENERMERLLVRLKRLHAENAELRTLLHEAIPDWGRRVGDAREQLGEPEAERLGDLLAEMRGLR